MWAQEIGSSFSVPFFCLSVNSLWVWEACLVADTHAVESLRVWEACFAADTHAEKSLWVWEACFIADTHTEKSLWVWEACFVADTQIVKTGRYNKGIIYSRRPAAGVRRITAKVKTVICEQAPNHGSYFAYARLCFRKLSSYTNLICRYSKIMLY